jgi:hypothetical protein
MGRNVSTQERRWACLQGRPGEAGAPRVASALGACGRGSKGQGGQEGRQAAAPEDTGGGWFDVASELLRLSLLELRHRLEQRRLTQDR